MNTAAEPKVEIELAGASVSIPRATIAELWLERVRPKPQLFSSREPRIGEPYFEGTYMGVVRGEKGEPDYRLIDLGEAPERMKWEEAMKWAESQGGQLPTRREQSILFGNRAEGQFKAEWYWSCEQCAGDADSAWVQHFDDGYQGDVLKGLDFRARAVRRQVIQ